MQNKHWIGVGVISLFIIASIGGFFVWHNKQSNEKISFGRASNNVSSEQAAGGSTTSTTSGGLNVGSAGSQGGLGQISPSGNQTSAQGNSTSSGSSSGSSSSGGGSQSIDPSTFAQYEKYKPETKALFGDIKVGDGATIGNAQTATVVYKGWLTNGQLFDQSKVNSEGKTEAFQFKIGSGQVIPGWDQGVAGMKVGGVRLIVVPPSVGYGTTDHGPIPANSVLVFQVQLVDVK